MTALRPSQPVPLLRLACTPAAIRAVLAANRPSTLAWYEAEPGYR